MNNWLNGLFKNKWQRAIDAANRRPLDDFSAVEQTQRIAAEETEEYQLEDVESVVEKKVRTPDSESAEAWASRVAKEHSMRQREQKSAKPEMTYEQEQAWFRAQEEKKRPTGSTWAEEQRQREAQREAQRLANDPEHRARFNGLAPSTPCRACKSETWGFLELSHNGLASKWKCLFCGKQNLVVADADGSEETGDAERSSRYISKEVRREVWRRDQGKCATCGSRLNIEFDHIVPVAKGGSNTARNVELLCKSCNRKKSANIQ